MAYNFVTTESKLILITSGKFVAHPFPALQQNLGCHKIKDDREMETAVTGWMITDINSEQKGSPHGIVNTPSIVAGVLGIAAGLKLNLRGKRIVNICRQTQQQYIRY